MSWAVVRRDLWVWVDVIVEVRRESWCWIWVEWEVFACGWRRCEEDFLSSEGGVNVVEFDDWPVCCASA